MTNNNIMVKIEDIKAFLMEIAYLNGFITGIDKDSRIPALTELNKIIEQLR